MRFALLAVGLLTSVFMSGCAFSDFVGDQAPEGCGKERVHRKEFTAPRTIEESTIAEGDTEDSFTWTLSVTGACRNEHAFIRLKADLNASPDPQCPTVASGVSGSASSNGFFQPRHIEMTGSGGVYTGEAEYGLKQAFPVSEDGPADYEVELTVTLFGSGDVQRDFQCAKEMIDEISIIATDRVDKA